MMEMYSSVKGYLTLGVAGGLPMMPKCPLPLVVNLVCQTKILEVTSQDGWVKECRLLLPDRLSVGQSIAVYIPSKKKCILNALYYEIPKKRLFDDDYL